MGNDMVGQVFDAMAEFRPDKTIMKIWVKKNLAVILAVKDPQQWQMEMDPFYVYTDGKIDGISFIDNEQILSKVMTDEYLVYRDKLARE